MQVASTGDVVVAAPGAGGRWRRAGSVVLKAVCTLLVALLAVPFLVVSTVLIGLVPAKLWPDDFATADAARDAAADVPEYPWALLGKQTTDDPSARKWLGFARADLAVETPYWLTYPTDADQVLEYYQRTLPQFGWTPVRVERQPGRARSIWRRRALGLILTVEPLPGGLIADETQTYRVRVGAYDGQTLWR